MFRPLTLILVLCAYVTVLFVIALWGERGSPLARRLTRSPVVYALALGVYCTSWTFYGSVGSAATAGPLFLTIYLGPTLAVILWPKVLRKLVRSEIVRRYDLSYFRVLAVTLCHVSARSAGNAG